MSPVLTVYRGGGGLRRHWGTYIGQRVVDGARGGPAQSLQYSFAELSGRRFPAVVHLCNHVSKSLLGSLRFFSAIGPGPDEETGCDL